jgi:hypothetical protein
VNLFEVMEATQKTVDSFKGRRFEWGKADCVQMAITHICNLGGKRIRVPDYGDIESGVRAMRALGFSFLSEALDKHCTPIDPQNHLMGDFIELPGGSGFSSISVDVGNGRVLCFHESIDTCEILEPLMIMGAWRVHV